MEVLINENTFVQAEIGFYLRDLVSIGIGENGHHFLEQFIL
tara:strand:+ start:422 stop:544 length:123 start_codon:yes stop_codon:yes gene_type:complete